MPVAKHDKLFDEVLQEHRQLKECVQELRGYLKLPRPSIGENGYDEWSGGLSERLVTLHDRVSRHFHREEEDRVLERLVRRHPRVAGMIGSLQAEHTRILADLRRLTMASLNYEDGMSPRDPRLRRRLNTILNRIARHEETETGLIMSVEYDDLGSCD